MYNLSNQNLVLISGAYITDIVISLATVGVTISVLVFIIIAVYRHRKQPKHGNHSNYMKVTELNILYCYSIFEVTYVAINVFFAIVF